MEYPYGQTPLFIAIQHGNLELIKVLIKANANVNARDNKKQTPLMLAAERGNN
ncbi:ankyrin repeat domain-containing protein [Solibacillus silvestris]